MTASTQATRNGGGIALFLPSLDGGGAERMMLNLAAGFVRRGLPVDLVLVKAKGPYLSQVPPDVRVVDLGAAKVVTSLLSLIRYLRRERPQALLSTLNTANVVAVIARRLACVRTRTIIRQAATLGATPDGTAPRLARFVPLLMQRFYPWADAVVAVSEGVAQDLSSTLQLHPARIRIAPNPVVDAQLGQKAREPLDHTWFAPGAPPVVLGVGRLTAQKDFSTLMRAVAEVRKHRSCRLMILGEGPDRPRLEAEARQLGLERVVALPGFVQNPFAYMARSAVFVLSSTWEGLPGALIQAMACGTPVVATDCPSGPREVLAGGRYGRLVPVGDVAALAEAIAVTLKGPACPVPAEAWNRYSDDAAVTQYLRVMQGTRNE